MKKLLTLLVAAFFTTAVSALGPGDPIQNGYVWHDSNVTPVTRNSANDATDDDRQAMHTFTIPPGVARAGDTIIVQVDWTHTNSANAKELDILVGSIGGPGKSQTTTVAHHTVHRFILDGSDTLRTLSHAGNWNGDGSAFLTGTNSGGAWSNGFTISSRSRWTTQPISGESITFYTTSITILRNF